MIKKSLFALATISTLTLAGCSITPTAKYKITDEQTKLWIEKSNQIEQCVFAEEYKNKDFSRLSQEQKFLHNIGVHVRPLIAVIGQSAFQTIRNDPLSQQYLDQQFRKFNHGNPTSFDQVWCNSEKQQYQQALKQLKAEKKQREVKAKKLQAEELARKHQAEKERKEREAFYKTPQGRIVKAQEEMMAAQIQAQRETVEAQRRMYMMQMAEIERQKTLASLNSINASLQGMANSMQQRANAYNQATLSMPQVQFPTYQNSFQQRSTTTCQNLMGIMHCTHR